MAIRDLKFDPITEDLVIENDDLVLVSDLDAIEQDLRLRLRFVGNEIPDADGHRGEWFLDETQGVPWFTRILVKTPDLAQIREILRKTILDTEGVTTLLALTFDYDPAARTLAVTFTAQTDLGELDVTLAGPIAA